ncbi:hypothetical protein SAMN04488505_102699 [Chitinophaga rupis]|uniref:Uncharacterized protein n=2 Tax=Chitinophaga rupis TaxID=573321 RepID=A0A1H7RPH7_9BACT|nr:hypothetical protein SAMN04488505_102699 [Chitinophaga rupis]
MKKIKIMLAAIIVIASVGGALALKAKNSYANLFCYKTIAGGAGFCTDCMAGKVGGNTTYYYTTTFNCQGCTLIQCTRTAKLTLE